MSELSRLPEASTYLEDLLDVGALTKAISDKWIKAMEWNGATIYNYTNVVQYGGHWTPETLMCRGLIVDAEGRILARPFSKFFNADEPSAPSLPPPDTPFTVSEKWDGSLGIGYRRPDGQWRISTRGSMASLPAQEATAIWKEKYAHVSFPPGITPLFEIVYPQWRIVIDYGDLRDLVLLGALDIATGADVPVDELDWPGPVARTRDFTSFGELAAYMKRPRSDSDPDEGFVIRFDLGAGEPSLRYKTKWIEYVEAHKVIFGLNRGKVWRELAAKDGRRRGTPHKYLASRLHMDPQVLEAIVRPDYDIRSSIPEEFHDWYDSTASDLRSEYDRRVSLYENLLRKAVTESSGPPGSKEFSLAVARLCNEAGASKGVLFAMSYGKPAAYAGIWREVEPPGEQGMRDG